MAKLISIIENKCCKILDADFKELSYATCSLYFLSYVNRLYFRCLSNATQQTRRRATKYFITFVLSCSRPTLIIRSTSITKLILVLNQYFSSSKEPG
jgi:hypothetical protein